MKAMTVRTTVDLSDQDEPRSQSNGTWNDEPDETLIDLFLELSISDRLRSLCRYVNAVQAFRTV
jgi:hypothetical protein